MYKLELSAEEYRMLQGIMARAAASNSAPAECPPPPSDLRVTPGDNRSALSANGQNWLREALFTYRLPVLRIHRMSGISQESITKYRDRWDA